MRLLFTVCLLSIIFAGCQRQHPVADADVNKPRRTLTEYFDKKYLLYKLPVDYYAQQKLNKSFDEENKSIYLYDNTIQIDFKPLGHDPNLNLQYTHVYSPQCVYHTHDTVWTYGEVSFPNTCLTKDDVYAHARIKNTSDKPREVFLRLFYQNTTYWNTDTTYRSPLDNYYGKSRVVTATIAPNSDTVIPIRYNIGPNPKNESDFDPYKDPARPGNYEFLLLAAGNDKDPLFDKNLLIRYVHPFLEIKKRQKDFNFAYVGPHHFKFVFLDEYFDGTNDLHPNHVWIAKDGWEKKLCDTCSGWFRGVISEHWNFDAYFTGFISKAPFVKADYGIKGYNYQVDSNGITLHIPASRRGDYKKTWGEFFFGPSFKYGHLTVRAKFAQMFSTQGGPNGIIHNLWLYQRDRPKVDTTNLQYPLINWAGEQPYEIDFEFWSSMPQINGEWDDMAFINYSIVDYMRDPNVSLKPGEHKQMGKYKAERLNERQAGIPGADLDKEFFNHFHTYELYWYPDSVRFLVDGYETAVITRDMASIPDKHMFLWIGSPLYQDGTYYSQSAIPFLKYDKRTIIDYVRIE